MRILIPIYEDGHIEVTDNDGLQSVTVREFELITAEDGNSNLEMTGELAFKPEMWDEICEAIVKVGQKS